MFAKRITRSAALLVIVLSALAFRPPPATPFPDFDRRQAANRPGKEPAVDALRTLIPDATVQFDPVTRSATHVAARRGFLSGPDGKGGGIGDAARNALQKNDTHRATKAFL